LILHNESLFRGRWICNDPTTTITTSTSSCDDEYKKYHYQLSQNEIVIARTDDDIVQLLESKKICGIQDDYPFWSQQNCVPWAGKPVWVTPPPPPQSSSLVTTTPNTELSADNAKSDYHHHVFFDDNIHNDPTDSIVAVRYCDNNDKNKTNPREEKKKMFTSLNGKDTICMQGKHVVRVPTIDAILDKYWFLRQIALAEKKVVEDGSYCF